MMAATIQRTDQVGYSRCKVKNCTIGAEYLCGNDVAGRGGIKRRVWVRCEEHARKFAKAHGIEFKPAQPVKDN